jgi:shikimate dehydrogenase
MSSLHSFQAQIVGVLGKPVDENPVGVMFEAAFRRLDMNWRYLNIEVDPEDLADAIKGVRAFHMKGAHITMPHKIAAIQYMDELAQDARIIGAINSIRVHKQKYLVGENTDGKGFLQGLNEDGNTDPTGKNIVILGAGGAARAIAVELALAGASKIVIVNRSEEKGKELSSLIDKNTPADTSFMGLKAGMEIPRDTDILVNATSIGFTDNSKPPINYASIHENMVVCDVIPNKKSTPFLEAVKKAGARTTVDGLRMIVYLGGINFKMWTGRQPPLSVMREAIQRIFGLQE